MASLFGMRRGVANPLPSRHSPALLPAHLVGDRQEPVQNEARAAALSGLVVCCSQWSHRQLIAFCVGITLFSPIEYYAVTIGRYDRWPRAS